MLGRRSFSATLVTAFSGPLGVLLSLLRYLEQFLGPRDDWVEDDRRLLFETLDGLGGHTFTKEKGPDDYVTTVNATPDAVERVLYSHYQRNLLSSRKYRTHHDGGKQWAVGSWVYDPPRTDFQHHVYLFETANGRTDIYAHREESVRDPDGHLNLDNGYGQVSGDPNNRVRDLLDTHKLQYGQRDL